MLWLFLKMITKLIRNHTREKAFLAHCLTKDWIEVQIEVQNISLARMDILKDWNYFCKKSHLQLCSSWQHSIRNVSQHTCYCTALVWLTWIEGSTSSLAKKHPLFRDEVSTNCSKDPTPTTTSSSMSDQLATQTTSLSAVRHRYSSCMHLRRIDVANVLHPDSWSPPYRAPIVHHAVAATHFPENVGADVNSHEPRAGDVKVAHAAVGV